MIQLRIHAAPDPKDSWLEVDGKRVGGVGAVVVSEHAEDLTVTFYAASGEGVEVVWEEYESPTSSH